MEYFINHQQYNDNDLRCLITEKIEYGEPWEQLAYAFMCDWLSDEKTIALQTSGSTGKPKEMVFPKSALQASAEATIDFFRLKKGDNVLLCLPAMYVAAKLMIVRSLVGGLNLVMLPPDGNPLAKLDCNIDFAALVPMQVQRALTENPDCFDKIRQVIIGGSTVSEFLREALLKVDTVAWETYGMTETLTHVAVKKINQTETFFKALPGVCFSVDARQCLVIDVPRIVDKPIVTNDVVELLDETRFVFKGRADDVINSGGKKMHPAEIESLLQPFIDFPFVISAEFHKLLGQQLILVIESTVQIYNVKTLFLSLEKHQQPRKIYCVPNLPRTDSGKIIRKDVRYCLSDLYVVWSRE